MSTTTARRRRTRSSRRRQRLVHLLAVPPVMAYIYATPGGSSPLTAVVRFVAVPVLVAAGLAMWLGPRFRKARARRARAT
jgi:hypothetical protein